MPVQNETLYDTTTGNGTEYTLNGQSSGDSFGFGFTTRVAATLSNYSFSVYDPGDMPNGTASLVLDTSVNGAPAAPGAGHRSVGHEERPLPMQMVGIEMLDRPNDPKDAGVTKRRKADAVNSLRMEGRTLDWTPYRNARRS